MNEENGLTRGWVQTTLGEICSRPQYGWTTKANSRSGQVRLLRTTDISGGSVNWDTVPYCTEIPGDLDAYKLTKGDIVISRAGSVGVSYLLSHLPFETVFASYLIRFRPSEGVDPQYVSYYLQTPEYWSSIHEQSAGIALANVNARKLEAIGLPLAPLSEQQRIVAAIEQQFSRLDAGVAALRRAQAKLKRYRAAVLKAAVEGKLTETWRAEHPTTEPASNLLERILAERRMKWEADLRAKGKDPTKVKYVEPAKPDMESLPGLPEGWCWASIGQVAECLDHKRVPVNKEERAKRIGTIPYYGANGQVGWINDYIFDEPLILVVEDETFLGREVPFSYKIIGRTWVNNHAHVLRPTSAVHVDYLNYSLVYYPFTPLTQGTTGRRKLTQKALVLAPYALPPFAEQEQIVAEVEQRLSVVNQLESTVEANLKRAERLRQSILKEAFAGRLVPQDPNDEPASVLLERIRGEREKRKHGAINKGRVVIDAVGEPVRIDVNETRQVELWESSNSRECSALSKFT